MKYNRMNRRMFLQGSGRAMMAIPFLQSLMPREAWGQAATAPRRYVSIVTSWELGHQSAWLPNTGGSVTNLIQPNRTLNPGGGHHPIHWQPLSEFATSASTPLAMLYGTNLNPYLQSVNIMRGLDLLCRYGHGMGASLGALPENDNLRGSLAQIPTIDAFLANNMRINPSRRLIFAGEDGGFEGVSRATDGSRSARINSFSQLYNALFDNGNFPESSSGTTTPGTPAHPRRDVLSRVLEDYNRVMNSRSISSADKVTLTNAVDKMSDIYRGLSAGTPPVMASQSCSHKSLARPSSDIGNAGSVDSDSKALVDLLTAAIMCDTGRIFTLSMNMPYDPWSGYAQSGGSDILKTYTGQAYHDSVSHTPFGVSSGTVNWQWVVQRQKYMISRIFAPLVRNLSAATDPSNGKSYLYNSLVHLGFESAQQHGHGSHPAILAGNAGGNLTSGNYIDYSDRTKGTFGGADNYSDSASSGNFSNNYFGVNYGRLLTTIAQAMGATASEYENDARNSQVYNRTDIGSANANLKSIGGYGYAFNADRNSGVYGMDGFFANLSKYDLTQFRNKLPMP